MQALLLTCLNNNMCSDVSLKREVKDFTIQLMLDPYPETAALQYSYSRKRLRTLDSGRRNISSIMLRHSQP
ncbi:hypothetical protein DPX16_8339 [Anabarilius grahami]|uniref:Uncharacterized protein n=1 Tax=Anabarilius grahami TaxID=495550 RepID=A0A3N0ZAS8_ANAGA|nr:hypothetical protein DPX16_8339 [Anabarilius grahami]